MRNLILLLCLITTSIKGQTIQILDIVTNKGIENVNIFSAKEGISSDKNGKANLSIFKTGETVTIQHISYEETAISISQEIDTIFLLPKTNLLNEITLSPPTKILSQINSIQSINITQNKATAKTSTQLLQTSLGINVQKSQAGGGSPNFRGMEANRLLLVVDGVTLNNAIYRSGRVQSSSSINPFFLEKVTILSAPSSIAYGGGAMGGALLFMTKNPKKDKTKNYFHQQFESSSNAILMNFLSFYSGRNSASLSGFSIKSIGNLKMGKRRKHGFENWGNESTVTKENEQLFTAYKQYDFIHKTDVYLSENETLSFNSLLSTSSNINRFDKLNDIKNNTNKYELWYYGPQKRISQSLKYLKKKNSFLFNELSSSISFQQVSESRHHKKKNELLLSNRYENVSIYDFNTDLKKKINTLTLSYGAGLRKQFIHSNANKENNASQLSYNTTRYPDGGSEVDDIFTYIQLLIPINKKFSIYSGARYNKNQLTANFNDTSTYQFPFSSIKNNNTSLISSVLLTYKFNINTNISLSLYNGFRNANVDDIGKVFSKNDIYVIVPNKDLSPEKSTNIEFGFNKRINKITFSSYLFHTQLNNAISRENSSLNGQDSIIYDGEIMRIQMNKNIESAKINGINCFVEYNLNQAISLSYKCNYIKGTKSNNKPLAHIPPFNSVLQINYTRNNHTLQFYNLYNEKKKVEEYDEAGIDNIEEATTEGSPSWNTLNINYTNQLDKNLSLSIGIENILDNHYKTFGSGISASGRNFTLSLYANF